MRSTFALLLVVLGALSVNVEACTPRKTQVYVADNFSLTAESLYAYVYTQQQLYSVDMYYDSVYDAAVFQGLCGIWNPPLIAPFDFTYWDAYASPSSALGVLGPLGPGGPLSALGPAGANSWNPSQWITGADCPFCTAVYKWLTALYSDGSNPLGYNGALGYLGPLTGHQVYAVMPHLGTVQGTTPFTHNLDITGVWGMLGPLGPLGALGLLGPLGPVGATGYSTVDPATNTSDGVYRNRTSGQVVRSVVVPFDASGRNYRVYDLFELYPMKTALSLGFDNDCSFAVDGALRSASDAVRFPFTSSRSQMLSVLVLPAVNSTAASFSTFALQLDRIDPTTAAATTVASSSLATAQQLDPTAPMRGYLNFAVVRARPGQRYQLTVRPVAYLPSAPNFRLVVTGTGFSQGPAPDACVDADLFNHWDIVAPFQSS